jgi:hypothetical protein
MRKNPIVAMLLTVFMLFAVVAPVTARTPEEIFQIRSYLINQTDALRAANQMSNDEVYSVYLDLNQVPQGTVSATVYKTVYENITTANFNNITIQPIQGINGAHDKVTRFWAYLDNNDDENFLALWGGASANTVMGYVYGTTKDQTLAAFVAGIPECLAQDRLYDSGDSSSSGSPTKATEAKPAENPDAWAGKYLATTFEIGATTYSVLSAGDTTAINNKPEVKPMDVAPYVKNDRTYVPVRYLAYSLGVPEDSVTWDSNARKVGITKGDTDISLIIGSPIMQTNKEPIAMDVAPEITNARTFLPARWVAEALGAEVEWDSDTKQTTIKMPIEPGN